MGKHNKQRRIERICPVCDLMFVTGSSIKMACSPECRIRLAARPFAGIDGCWEWKGSINPDTGYGQLSEWRDGRRILLTAHRLSYRTFVHDPGELQVLHRCDNRKCFNPSHLFEGTQRENMRDCAIKGRAPGSKLSTRQLEEICSSPLSGAELSRQYGVSQTCISEVRLGKRAARPLT